MAKIWISDNFLYKNYYRKIKNKLNINMLREKGFIIKANNLSKKWSMPLDLIFNGNISQDIKI